MVGKCTYQIYEVERMKKVNNEKHESRNKNILIGALLAVILIMGVGYAAFAQQLTINGTASISSTWQVELTDIESTGHTGTGVDVPYAAGTAEDGTQLVNTTTAQFKADLTLTLKGLSFILLISFFNRSLIKLNCFKSNSSFIALGF